MENTVGRDASNPVERASAAIESALTMRPAITDPGATHTNLSAGRTTGVTTTGRHDDHFEDQAQATLSQWAALRRALERANTLIDELRGENAESKARIGELVRANTQLSASLDESLKREGEAKEQAGWLKGIMQSAAGALMEGLGQRSAGVVTHEDRNAMLGRFSLRESRRE